MRQFKFLFTLIFFSTFFLISSQDVQAALGDAEPVYDSIVYYGHGNGEDIFIMNNDGTNRRQLTSVSGDDHAPSVSKDGRFVYFNSNRTGSQDIYVMNIDGSDQTRLTSHLAPEFAPVVSPDGQKIVFYSTRDASGAQYGNQQAFEIYTMNIDGTGIQRLTYNSFWDGPAQWSPDGQKIVFTSERDGNHEIYVMDADGANQARLTFTANIHEYVPTWSPDGQYIAYNNNTEIFRMNADGSNQINITSNPLDEGWPAWSPDGNTIAFQVYENGWDIYFMNINGTNRRKISNFPGNEVVPKWTPLSAPNPEPNAVPVAGNISVSSDLVVVGTTVFASAMFTDANTNDVHTALWEWGDGGESQGVVTESDGEGGVVGNHAYLSPGVYTVRLTITDQAFGVGGNQFMYVVVYDPQGGFLTGAGRFDAPSGSIVSDPERNGMTNFGLNAKYVGGNLTGSARLHFRDGSYVFKFDSISYSWLVIDGGTAQLRGTGMINGSGNYDFQVTAQNDPDTFRIQIWDQNTLVYDNATSLVSQGDVEVHN